MSNDTKVVEEISKLNGFECIRIVAASVMFIVMTFGDRRTWVLADCFGSLMLAFFHLLAPQIFLKQYIAESDIDEIHCVVTQIFSAFLFASSVYRLLVRKSRDETVGSSLVWSRFITLTLFVALGLYVRYTPKFYLRHQSQSFVLYGTLIWWLSTVVQLCRYVHPQGGVETPGVFTFLLRLEFLISLVFSLVHLAYPGWLLGFQIQRAKLFHRYLIRMVGIALLGSALQAEQAVTFRYDLDRKSFFLSRVLSYAICAVALARFYVFDGVFNAKEMAIASLMFLNAIPSVIGLILSMTGYGSSKTREGRTTTTSYSYYTRSHDKSY